MTSEVITVCTLIVGFIVWLLRLEAKVISLDKYVSDEPKKFEQRISKVEQELGVVRQMVNRISNDVSYIRGRLEPGNGKHIDD